MENDVKLQVGLLLNDIYLSFINSFSGESPYVVTRKL